MKCKHCGAELKQLLLSWYCPNDCDLWTGNGPSEVSDETRTSVITKAVKPNYQVQIGDIILVINDNLINMHGIKSGDLFTVLHAFKDSNDIIVQINGDESYFLYNTEYIIIKSKS